MTEREALKLVRQLLWRYRHETPIGNQPYMICQKVDEAFERIDEALAQPEQEPVAWLDEEKKVIYWHNTHEVDDYHGFKRTTPLYTTPQKSETFPQRTWVGLTADELNMIGDRMRTWNSHSLADVYVAIEAKLKEKNT